MVSNISVLGSTGSIGVQALEVAKELGLNISALAVYSNIKLLEEQVRYFKPRLVCVYEKSAAEVFKNNIKDLNVKIVSGLEGLCEAACITEAEMVLNSVVGMIGLQPTIEAIKSGKNIALANKETLVVGGDLVTSLAKKKGVKILPVDSEHSAIFQCLQGCSSSKELKKIILTASGGPFFGKDRNYLKNVKKEQALRHPNWSMGAKITIDSATMMNKGLEVIEACHLFDVTPNEIEVVIHRESIVHSMVEFNDNSIIAQLGVPSMKLPIQYAITYPERLKSTVEELNLAKLRNISFYEPDNETFDCLKLCIKAFEKGGTCPCVVNAANEEAVKLFLNDKISFLEIGELIRSAMTAHKMQRVKCIEDIIAADKNAREYVINKVEGN